MGVLHRRLVHIAHEIYMVFLPDGPYQDYRVEKLGLDPTQCGRGLIQGLRPSDSPTRSLARRFRRRAPFAWLARALARDAVHLVNSAL